MYRPTNEKRSGSAREQLCTRCLRMCPRERSETSDSLGRRALGVSRAELLRLRLLSAENAFARARARVNEHFRPPVTHPSRKHSEYNLYTSESYEPAGNSVLRDSRDNSLRRCLPPLSSSLSPLSLLFFSLSLSFFLPFSLCSCSQTGFLQTLLAQTATHLTSSRMVRSCHKDRTAGERFWKIKAD